MNTLGIIAGTPIDTKMGIEYFKKRKIRSIGMAVGKSPQEQTFIEQLSPIDLTKKVIKMVKESLVDKIDGLVIYCNSLSGAIDIDLLGTELEIPILTPHNVYKKISIKYDYFGVLAANCQSLSKIEKTFVANNKNAKIFGLANINIVIDIEQNMDPADIIKKYFLIQVFDLMKSCKVNKIILGCTHFVYLMDVLCDRYNGLIYEPSEEIAKEVQSIFNCNQIYPNYFDTITLY